MHVHAPRGVNAPAFLLTHIFGTDTVTFSSLSSCFCHDQIFSMVPPGASAGYSKFMPALELEQNGDAIVARVLWEACDPPIDGLKSGVDIVSVQDEHLGQQFTEFQGMQQALQGREETGVLLTTNTGQVIHVLRVFSQEAHKTVCSSQC